MPYMFVTRVVSKLRGWLKRSACCRESKAGHRGAGEAAGDRGARSVCVCTGEDATADHRGTAVRGKELTQNMPYMFVTLEVSQPEMSALKWCNPPKSPLISVTRETHQPAMAPYFAMAAAAFESYSVAAVLREALSVKVLLPVQPAGGEGGALGGAGAGEGGDGGLGGGGDGLGGGGDGLGGEGLGGGGEGLGGGGEGDGGEGLGGGHGGGGDGLGGGGDGDGVEGLGGGEGDGGGGEGNGGGGKGGGIGGGKGDGGGGEGLGGGGDGDGGGGLGCGGGGDGGGGLGCGGGGDGDGGGGEGGGDRNCTTKDTVPGLPSSKVKLCPKPSASHSFPPGQ